MWILMFFIIYFKNEKSSTCVSFYVNLVSFFAIGVWEALQSTYNKVQEIGTHVPTYFKRYENLKWRLFIFIKIYIFRSPGWSWLWSSPKYKITKCSLLRSRWRSYQRLEHSLTETRRAMGSFPKQSEATFASRVRKRSVALCSTSCCYSFRWN